MQILPDQSKPISVQLTGPLKLTAFDGTDLTPRGNKTCALFALLLLSPNMQRNRRWLEAKLWSTRSQEQAYASMRQALSDARKCLLDHRNYLGSDRKNVWLKKGTFKVDILESPERNSKDQEILEGLDVRDPEFENWLRDLRTSCDSIDQKALPPTLNSISPLAPSIILSSYDSECTVDTVGCELINQQIARNLSDSADIDLIMGGLDYGIVASGSDVLEIKTRVITQGSTAHLSLTLSDVISRKLLWSRQSKADVTINPLLCNDEIYKIANEAADRAMNTLCTSRREVNQSSNALVTRALKEMFSFDAARLRVADGLLKAAQKSNPHPTLLAWRSFLRMIMFVERTETDIRSLREEAEVFAVDAIEQAPTNSLVLSIISQVRLLLNDDVDGPSQLAHDSVALNSGGSMPHISLAAAALRQGEISTAQKEARNSINIAPLSPHRHWLQMFGCLTNIAANDYDAAISNAESALSYAPKFRPPLRHLYALYLKNGQLEKASVILKKLRQIEPDFSLQFVRDNQNYPAGTLRRSNLIDQVDIT